jgi:hypothetical protein
MNRPKQIIIAIFLLIVVGIPGILFVYYQAEQAWIRHEMEEKLEHQHLQTIRIPARDVVWYEEDKEIIVDGKLFDVKTQTPDQDMIVFTGLFDDKETLVKNQMEKLQQEQNSDKENETIVVKYVSIELFNEIKSSYSLPDFEPAPKNYISYNDNRPLTGDLTPPAPPPKAI